MPQRLRIADEFAGRSTQVFASWRPATLIAERCGTHVALSDCTFDRHTSVVVTNRLGSPTLRISILCNLLAASLTATGSSARDQASTTYARHSARSIKINETLRVLYLTRLPAA